MPTARTWKNTKDIALDLLNTRANLKLNWSTMRNWTEKNLRPIIGHLEDQGCKPNSKKIRDLKLGYNQITYVLVVEVLFSFTNHFL